MAYIEAPTCEAQAKENPFLKIPNEPDEKKALLIHKGPHSFIVMNKFPYNAGHLLAVPYREVPRLEELSADERADLMETIVKAQDILTKALAPHGFNVGFNFGKAAGAGIPTHLHCHIVPRWEGDSNFMPVIAGTRCLPDALDTMWERLRKFV